MRALRLSTTKRIRSTLPGRDRLGDGASWRRTAELSAVLGHSHFSSALEGFEGQEHVGHTPSLILKVDTLFGLPGLQASDSRTSANRAGRVSRQSTLLLLCSDRRALRRGPGSLPCATRTTTGRCTRVGSPTA